MRKEKKLKEMELLESIQSKSKIAEIEEELEYKQREIERLYDDISDLEDDVRLLESEKEELIKKNKSGLSECVSINKNRFVRISKAQQMLEAYNAI